MVRISPKIRQERARIAKMRPKSVLVTKRPNIRLKVADFVFGRTDKQPPPIETRGGQVFLCLTDQGKRVILPTSFSSKVNVVTQCRKQGKRIIAETYSRNTWLGGIEKKEAFLVHDGTAVLPQGQPINNQAEPAKAKAPSSPIISNRTLILQRGANIESWLIGTVESAPETYAWQLTKDGKLHLCPVGGEPVKLLISSRHKKRVVEVSFANLSEYNLITVKVGRLNWEFEVTRDSSERSLRFWRRLNDATLRLPSWSKFIYY